MHCPLLKCTVLAALLACASCATRPADENRSDSALPAAKAKTAAPAAAETAPGKTENLPVTKVTIDLDKLYIAGKTDRNPVELHSGDKVTFTVSAIQDETSVNEYFLDWSRTGDDGKIETGRHDLSSGLPLTVTTTLDRPGFVRILAFLCDADGNHIKRSKGDDIFFDGGAGFDIDRIENALPEPEDFDAYWERQKAALAAVPMQILQRLELPTLVEGFRLWRLKISCAGPRPVTAYLIIPQNKPPMKAVAYYYGYNYRPYEPSKPWFRDNQISLHVNAHGCDLGESNQYYSEFAQSIKSNGYDYAFDPQQNSDPDTSYFHGMAFRVLRSLEFLRTLPEWDGKNLVANGYSQGGMQAVWAAALDPNVSLCDISIPWNADMGGYTTGRLHGDWHLQYVPGLGYYDSAIHARRIHCQMDITRAGLGDYVCPPTGVTCIYNNARGPKRIIYVQGSEHGYVQPHADRFTVERK